MTAQASLLAAFGRAVDDAAQARRTDHVDLVLARACTTAVDLIRRGHPGHAEAVLTMAGLRAERILSAGPITAPLPEHVTRTGERCSWSGLVSMTDACPAGCTGMSPRPTEVKA